MPTPMMQQYEAVKKDYPDKIVFFRMGDFYEMFKEDAGTAARVLGIALTSRDKGPNAIPMAGVPHHSVETYVARMVRAGYDVVICDQVEDPAEAKGLVDRKVTRVITPATLTEDLMLDADRNNYLLAVSAAKGRREKAGIGLAWCDLSTGEFTAAFTTFPELIDEVTRLDPAEVLLPDEEVFTRGEVFRELEIDFERRLTPFVEYAFDRKTALTALKRHFGVETLAGFGVDDGAHYIGAAGAVIEYLSQTQKTNLLHITSLKPSVPGSTMFLDAATRSTLELTRTMRTAEKTGSLLGVLDKTQTAGGARLLSRWVLYPLVTLNEILYRQRGVAEFHEAGKLREDVSNILKEFPDVERISARLGTERAGPRDLVYLKNALRLLPRLSTLLSSVRSPALAEAGRGISDLSQLADLIDSAIVEDPPHNLKEGGIVREAYSAELDDLRKIAKSGKEWIIDYRNREAERSGISQLKVGFNRVFGYYVEVSNIHREKVPDDYIRKQTLKNCERYITPELKEYESRILNAEETANALEYRVFRQVREEAASHIAEMTASAARVSFVDALLSLAKTARAGNYVRPEMDDSTSINIVEGRHPVLEVTLVDSEFVPNDLVVDADGDRLLIITGPNMAGKSTYIRQAALIVLLAQIGSFVPAKKAGIGVVDRIFTRVGSADEIARGRSTFMVEMTETANILHNATKRSLIVFDEVGRGTSTFDGLAIAWATSEYVYNHLSARTLFATHYHQLADLAEIFTGIRNYNVIIREWKDEIRFLHRVVEGSTDRSYGIQVAKLAGVPEEVIRRAKELLLALDRENVGLLEYAKESADGEREIQKGLYVPRPDPRLREILSLEIDKLSGIDALNFIARMQEDLEAEGWNRDEGNAEE